MTLRRDSTLQVLDTARTARHQSSLIPPIGGIRWEEREIPVTYTTDTEKAELANLYHLANTALAGLNHVPGVLKKNPTRYERMCYVAKEYAREHDVTEIRAYKMVDAALTHDSIDWTPFGGVTAQNRTR